MSLRSQTTNVHAFRDRKTLIMTSTVIASSSPQDSVQQGLNRTHSLEVKRTGSAFERMMIAGSLMRKRWAIDQPHERSSS